MKIEKDSIITLEDGRRYLILGKTCFMYCDYYPAMEIKEDGTPAERKILMEEQSDIVKFPMEWNWDGENLEKESLCFLEDRHMEAMLWAVFTEQCRNRRC